MAVRRLAGAPAAPDPAALAPRIERAEAEQLARTGAPFRAGALAVSGGLAVSKGPRSASSAAFGLGLRGPVSEEDLDRVEAHLGALGGDVRVELCVHAHPSLAAALGRRGYHVERVLLVLARAAAPYAPAGAAAVAVRELAPGEERAFAEAFGLAHLGRPPSPDELEDLLAVPRARGSACFAAFDGGALVAVAVASEHDGVASLSGAGVVPGSRGRGLQLALLHARLAWAARRGCDVAASAVTPGGASQRNLERAGFRVAYAK
ncbi:MAG TPA: GNAT family N-acetyltransferase, partial [Anaeromyxobacter sp.]|nr:GNAT family N-acetyltransferase [Anaeromyxobacter sp.]